MAQLILILNGPNLNLLGTREPEIYGSETLADIEAKCRAAAAADTEIDFRQTNQEGTLLDWVHEARGKAAAIVINPGAFTHTSVALLDALKSFDGPVLELHISNIHQRESFRHISYVSLRADGVVAGFGTDGYVACLQRAENLLRAAD